MLAECIAVACIASNSIAYAPQQPQERLGTLRVPRIHLVMPVRQGTNERVLDRGVGHYPYTYLPGMGGRIVLPAHDVTPVRGRPYGPFRHIYRLRRGDGISFATRYGKYRYVVTGHRKVRGENTRYLRPTLGKEKLVLATCWPPHSRAYRYLVVARRMYDHSASRTG